MIYEVQRLLDDYMEWLKDKTILREIDDWGRDHDAIY